MVIDLVVGLSGNPLFKYLSSKILYLMCVLSDLAKKYAEIDNYAEITRLKKMKRVQKMMEKLINRT